MQFVDYATHRPQDATPVCSVPADAAWLAGELILDVAEDGRYMGIEVLSASRTLRTVPHRR